MKNPRSPSASTRRVLGVFLSQPQAWLYGYPLTKATGVKSGTLYPLLKRLQEQGLLEAEWRPSPQAGRPPRHAYRLTAQGRAFAETWATAAAPAASPSAREAEA